MKHFEAKTDHFEPKIPQFEPKLVHFGVETGHFEAFWQLWKSNFPKRKPYFFDEFVNGPFSAKSWPGTLWKLKFAILSLHFF